MGLLENLSGACIGCQVKKYYGILINKIAAS
jgi:hypothetical protein